MGIWVMIKSAGKYKPLYDWELLRYMYIYIKSHSTFHNFR